MYISCVILNPDTYASRPASKMKSLDADELTQVCLTKPFSQIILNLFYDVQSRRKRRVMMIKKHWLMGQLAFVGLLGKKKKGADHFLARTYTDAGKMCKLHTKTPRRQSGDIITSDRLHKL